MNTNQETALKRMKFFYGKLKDEEDFKAANAIAAQILTLETQIEKEDLLNKQKSLSPLN